MTPEEEVKRGREAQLVLSNAVYREAMIAIRGQLMEKFQKTKYDESAERDEIWRKMQTIEWLEAYLSDVMQTGKLGESTQKMGNFKEH